MDILHLICIVTIISLHYKTGDTHPVLPNHACVAPLPTEIS